MRKKRIVITGIGIVSPIGIGKDEFWKNLFAGKSGIKPITLFDTSNFKVKVGGEITDFAPKEILNEKNIMDLDRATLLLLSASKIALDDAGLKINEDNTCRCGVSVGTTFGNLNSISKFNKESFSEGPRYANPSVFPSTVGNSCASRISIKFKIKGFNATISTGMCAGLDALEYAGDCLELERAEKVLAGSVEDLNRRTFLGLYKLGYLSGVNGGAPLSCPFDKRRDGLVFAEGATIFILQGMDIAKDEKKHIYAEILGTGSTFDPARFYRYNPKGTGMKSAMSLAIENAQLSPEDVDCIFANANSTRGADAIETLAIKDVFGRHAEKIPVTATKSITGETLSNSGALAIAAGLGTLEKGIVPEILNFIEKDKNCDLDYVIGKPRKKNILKIMVNSFAPNGANTSMIIGKYNG
ncbi:MAG: beta-ketoacyl-[acyl-carrier-protein] synthase family protein [Candidatus Omnitrophica bacterium]|nr:beta-ketoacyl-[acyl-carrier-protein] synthase family protein [Candidatus Omnitrophota bacterium]